MKDIFSNRNYNAKERIKEIEEAISQIRKDGLKVGAVVDEDNNVKLFVENTVATFNKQEGYNYSDNDSFAYAEIKL